MMGRVIYEDDVIKLLNDSCLNGVYLTESDIKALPSALPGFIVCKDCENCKNVNEIKKPLEDGCYYCLLHGTFVCYCSERWIKEVLNGCSNIKSKDKI